MSEQMLVLGAGGRDGLAASTLHHSASGSSHCSSQLLCAVFPFGLCSLQSSKQKNSRS